MPLILPVGFDGPPWGICEKFLRKYYEKAQMVFKATSTPTSGFIVAHWEDEAGRMPTHYLRRLKFLGTAFLSHADFVKFGDDGLPKDPYRYKTLTAVLRIVEIARKKLDPRFGLVFWCHSDATLLSNEYYQAMLGGEQLPRSVTQ